MRADFFTRSGNRSIQDWLQISTTLKSKNFFQRLLFFRSNRKKNPYFGEKYNCQTFNTIFLLVKEIFVGFRWPPPITVHVWLWNLNYPTQISEKLLFTANFEREPGSPVFEGFTSVTALGPCFCIFSLDRTNPDRYDEQFCAFISSIFSIFIAL